MGGLARSQTWPLTHRERFCRLYDFQRVDRLVRWEAVAFWGQTVDEWKGNGGLPPHIERKDVMAYYGMEPRPTVSGGLGLTAMQLSGPPVEWHVIEETAHAQVIENDLGAIRRIRTDGTSMPQFVRFPVESDADWRRKIKPRLQPGSHAYGNLTEELATCAEYPDAPVGLWLVGLYAFWRNFWGEVNLAYAFYDAPETLHDMAATWLRMQVECTPRLLAAIDVDWTLFHEDMACKGGPLIGPGTFEQFMAPYYRELLAHLRQHGQHRLAVDSDGNNGQVLERFAELGINGLYPFEVAAGSDAVAFRKRHPQFFVWGACDKRALLGTQDDVEREVMSKVPTLWEQGGFIPSVDHSVPPCPQENFEFFLELVRDICR